jgi:hypothetical protein
VVEFSLRSPIPFYGLNIQCRDLRTTKAQAREGLVRGHTLVAAAWIIFVSVMSCPGQLKVDNSPDLIRHVLKQGNASGSVVYSDNCESVGWRISVPPHVRPARNAGTTIEILRDMFSDYPGMRVSQDLDGIIRMVGQGVPTDILDVKIRRIEFDPSHRPLPELFHGPNMALATILSSPEVRLFAEKHNIAPTSFRLEGSMGQDLPAMTGELDDVTLSQALDYVLKVFPGYWMYENCTSNDGQRTVHFQFYY